MTRERIADTTFEAIVASGFRSREPKSHEDTHPREVPCCDECAEREK